MKNVGQRPPGHRLIVNWSEYPLPSGHKHKYGGTPSNGAILPVCSGCRGRLHLLMQIDLADPELGYLNLNGPDYLLILTCLNCASYEKPMHYRLVGKRPEIVVLHEEPGVCVQEYPDPLVEHPVQLRALKDNEYPATETNLLHLLEQEGKHQVGGEPIWVQYKEYVQCIVCTDVMEYIAMVDSELYIGENGFRERGHMFGDEGILYVWACRKCNVLATKAQSV
jgi:hypothetical protein